MLVSYVKAKNARRGVGTLQFLSTRAMGVSQHLSQQEKALMVANLRTNAWLNCPLTDIPERTWQSVANQVRAANISH